MDRFRINITNHLAWGNLVKSWATGLNYVDYIPTEAAPLPPAAAPGTPLKWPRPTSFKDFATQAITAKAGLVFEDANQTPVTGDEGLGFLLVQGTLDMFVLKLPATEALQRSEQQLIGGEGYDLPDFYDRIYESHVKDNEVATKVQRMTLHAERIGEYTMNTCH